MDTEVAVLVIPEYPVAAVHMRSQNTDPGIVQREFESDEWTLGALRNNTEIDRIERPKEDVEGLPIETQQ